MSSGQRLFFSHTVAAMFAEAFPPEQHPGLRERYLALGLDLGKPLLPAYEYATWRACLRAQQEVALAGVAPGEAAFQQGARYVDAYFDRTRLGGALLLVLRVIGARRTLERMAHNFRSANNFSQVSMQRLEGNHAELHVNDIFADSPEYIRGMLVQGLRRSGATLAIETLRHEGDAAVFRVSWG
jgi:uncharacterized protein (TIGR02265 family)